jgi:hypothetical protein
MPRGAVFRFTLLDGAEPSVISGNAPHCLSICTGSPTVVPSPGETMIYSYWPPDQCPAVNHVFASPAPHIFSASGSLR